MHNINAKSNKYLPINNAYLCRRMENFCPWERTVAWALRSVTLVVSNRHITLSSTMIVLSKFSVCISFIRIS